MTKELLDAKMREIFAVNDQCEKIKSKYQIYDESIINYLTATEKDIFQSLLTKFNEAKALFDKLSQKNQ